MFIDLFVHFLGKNVIVLIDQRGELIDADIAVLARVKCGNNQIHFILSDSKAQVLQHLLELARSDAATAVLVPKVKFLKKIGLAAVAFSQLGNNVLAVFDRHRVGLL